MNTATTPSPEEQMTQMRRRLDESHERLETTHVRLMEAEMALTFARSTAVVSKDETRRLSVENQLAVSEARAAETQNRLEDSNMRGVIAERVLREMEGLLRELETRRAETEDRLAVAEERLQTAHATIERLVAQLEHAQYQAVAAELRYVGIGPMGLAVARRISRLTKRFPRSSDLAKRTLRKVHGLARRAA